MNVAILADRAPSRSSDMPTVESRSDPPGGTLVVAVEHHFVDVGGRIYTSMSFGYDYWRQYLEVFRQVKVLARVGHAAHIPQNHFLADGPGVGFIFLPDYLGPKQFVKHLPAILQRARAAALAGDHFLLRTGNVCTAIWIWLLLQRKQYAREVLGDTIEAITYFTRGSRNKRVNYAMALASDWLAAIQLKNARWASYVSEYCRQRYPTRSRRHEYVFSDVQLSSEMVTSARPASHFSNGELRLVTVGRLEPEKGHDVLISSLAQLREQGIDTWSLRIIGPGRQQRQLQDQVDALRLSNNVQIMGPVQHGHELSKHLDWAHVFVLPSLTEGLPRALIEAMARGLPAVASAVGGVPELLPPSQLVPPGDAGALASAIAHRTRNRGCLTSDSEVNFAVAESRYAQGRQRDIRLRFWYEIARIPQRRLLARRNACD